MRAARRKKMLTILAILGSLALATTFVLLALKQNINWYYTPTELLEVSQLPKGDIKLGGVVKHYRAQQIGNTLQIEFVITDFKSQIPVTYQGTLPDLFREGKGIVAQGKYQQGRFEASQVLAKHDENYMPPNIQENQLNAS